MTVVLVTVAGLSGRRDLVVPADVPIGDLLGPVAAALAGGDPVVPAAGGGGPEAAGQAGWRLAPLGGDALPPERSLAACGIGDGATLTLTVAAAPPGPRGAAPLGHRLPAPPGPGGAAGGGWSPVGWWRRGSRSHDQEDEPLEAAIAAPRLRRCAVVGVVSAVDGVGRTTVAALLASVLAATRDGLTVAVDTHPAAGSRPKRPTPDDGVSAGDLLGLLDHPALTTDELAACLARRGAGPALVAPGAAASRSPAPAGGDGLVAPLDRRAWTLLVHGLARHAGALVLDCGPGLGGAGARAVLATADQLVLVTEPVPSPESRRVAAALADLGHAVAVAAGAAAPPGADGLGSRRAGRLGSGSFAPAGLARLLPGVRGVVSLAPPPPVAPPREWAEVPPCWRRPARELAFLLAADWPALGVALAGG
jgi:WXG100 protein secretion system (Wss), protein YukD